MNSLSEVFSQIYKRQDWGHGSGPGSSPRNVLPYRLFLEQFIQYNQIKTVTDLGCGDWQFSRYVDWSSVTYTGFDVVLDIVEINKRNFSSPTVNFRQFEQIEDLPGGDLLLAKEVLQHLPNATVADYIESMRKRYRFLLITNTCGSRGLANGDITAGGIRSLRLDEPPFSLTGATTLTYNFTVDGVTYRNETFLIIGD